MFPEYLSLNHEKLELLILWLGFNDIRFKVLYREVRVTYRDIPECSFHTVEEALQYTALCLCYEDFKELGLYEHKI